MSGTVVIQPSTLNREQDSDVELVQLRILAAAAEWEGVFDQIEIHRSTSLRAGPYSELTDERWRPARVPDDAGDQVDIPPIGPAVHVAGLNLEFRLDDKQDYVINISGTNPLTYNEVAAQLVTRGTGQFTAYVDADARFVLSALRPGTASLLEITGGDAAPLLGVPVDPPDNSGRGRDARINLVPGIECYDFTDFRGSKRYFYRTRFRNAGTGAVSEFSTPFSVGQALGISPSNIVLGILNLVQTNGRPLANQMVQVYAPTQTELVEDWLVTGPRQSQLTDINGHVEFALVRGIDYTISVTGTDIVREVRAPEDESIKTFNMLSGLDGTQSDAFKVQAPVVNYAPRRSL